MRAILQVLIGGVRVHGRHQTPLDPKLIVEDLGHGGKTVGRARGVGDDVVGAWVVLVVVHTHHNGEVFTRSRSGNDDLLGASRNVCAGLVSVGEEPGGLDDNVNAERRPREVTGIALGKHRDLLAIDGDEAIAGCDLDGQATVNRVILQQVGQCLGIGEVVHRHNVELV